MRTRGLIVLSVLLFLAVEASALEASLPGCWRLATEATQVCKQSGECVGMARFENEETGENVVCNRIERADQKTWLLHCGGSLNGREFLLDFKTANADRLFCPTGN